MAKWENFTLNVSSTVSSNFTEEPTDESWFETLRWLLIPIYSLVIIVGVFGNGILVFIIVKHKRLHSVTNYFIARWGANGKGRHFGNNGFLLPQFGNIGFGCVFVSGSFQVACKI